MKGKVRDMTNVKEIKERIFKQWKEVADKCGNGNDCASKLAQSRYSELTKKLDDDNSDKWLAEDNILAMGIDFITKNIVTD